MKSAKWQSLAERAARTCCNAILARVEAAIAEHVPEATLERSEGMMRARGRRLKWRWISDAGLRFARRIGR